MRIEPQEMQDVKSNFEKVCKDLEALGTIWETGEKGQNYRIAFLRALAELSRENSAARSIVEKLLDTVNIKHSEEAIAFRAYYLDGKKKPTARQISHRLYIDVRTVYKYNRRILIAMLPVAFGVYGLFYPDISKRYDDKPNGPMDCHRDRPLDCPSDCHRDNPS